MRRAATATAIVLAGGGAAVGLLYATGPQAMLTSADPNAHSVTSATRPGGAEGAATTLATPAADGPPPTPTFPGTRPPAGSTPP